MLRSGRICFAIGCPATASKAALYISPASHKTVTPVLFGWSHLMRRIAVELQGAHNSGALQNKNACHGFCKLQPNFAGLGELSTGQASRH